MSVIKQIPRLFKLYFLSKKSKRRFLDGTYVSSFFYQNLFDICYCQHRLVRVCKSSNKKSFAFKLFHFGDLRTLPKSYKKSENFQGRTYFFDWQFSKTFDKASRCFHFSLMKHKIERGSTRPNDNTFTHHCKDIFEHPNRQIRLSFQFGNNSFCVFSSKKFELQGKQFSLPEIVKFEHRQIQHLSKNWYYEANKCQKFESIYDVKRSHLWFSL